MILMKAVVGIGDLHGDIWKHFQNTGVVSAGTLATKKTPFCGYRNPHYKPNMVWLPSQVHNGNPYTNKTASSLWIDHYNDVIMSTIASPITSLTIVYSTIYSGADQSKHQSYASLAFVWGIHRGPVNSPHKWPVTRKMFPFDDVMS